LNKLAFWLLNKPVMRCCGPDLWSQLNLKREQKFII
jgi:hypothetical protein